MIDLPIQLRSKRGTVLPVVVITIAVATLLLSAVFGYVSSSTRATIRYMGASQARLAAQSSIEYYKTRMHSLFFNYYRIHKNNTIGKVLEFFPSVNRPTQILSLGGTSFVLQNAETINQCKVKTTVWSIRHVGDDGNAAKKHALVTLRATATTPQGYSRTIEEVVKFGLERAPVFDYAYFVNNYGWFQGSAGTANGDIRANGNFGLDGGCHINGFAYAQGVFSNTGRAYPALDYWYLASTRARPTSPTHKGGATWKMGYDADRVTGSSYDERLKDNQKPVPMPFIGELDTYIDLAEQSYKERKKQGGNASALQYYDKESGRYKSIDYHHDDAGPSGEEGAVDEGCLLLVGTRERPIKIQGLVVVDKDLLISGVVEGQGTIYSGRNVHILNNLTYKNSPYWPKPDYTPEKTAENNKTKDLLGLAAKGNIVLGDYSRYHTGTVASYLKPPFVKPYECDKSDADIGYGTKNDPTFDGNYINYDGGKKTNIKWKDVFNYDTWQWEKVPVVKEEARRYYESSCDLDEIEKLVKSIDGRGISTSIQQVDAVLYNNHAILGNIGQCAFNGALVCRDEAIIYYGSLKMNWDIRIGSDSLDGTAFDIYLPLSIAEPHPVSWREIGE